MRISDWSSDVCSSDLDLYARVAPALTVYSGRPVPDPAFAPGAVLAALGYDADAVRARREAWSPEDRESVGSGKSVSVRVGFGGRRFIIKTKTNTNYTQQTT